MPALELLCGSATYAAANTWYPLTMFGSDSLTVRSFDVTQKARLVAMWHYVITTAGAMRLRSPRMHDNVQGIRLRTNYGQADPLLWSSEFLQPLYAQDTLIAETMNTAILASAGVSGHLIYYPTLPGVAANLISPANLQKNGMHIIGQDLAFAAGALGYTAAPLAINSQAGCDNFQANMWYALIGAITDIPVAAVRVQGVDVGNLGVGIPGCTATPELSGRWFIVLSEKTGIPLIPCFNSANKFSIFVSIANNTAASAVNVTLQMVLLGPTITPGT